MKIYIDDLKLIRVETTKGIKNIDMMGFDLQFLRRDRNNIYYETNRDIELHIDNIINVNGNNYNLLIGLVTLSKDFDIKYRYDGTLGYIYNKEYTNFKLFSPVAKEVFVVIDNVRYKMQYIEPIWVADVLGDLEGLTYEFDIRLEDKFKRVQDPYAKAAGYKANYIIDWSRTNPINKTSINILNQVEAVIYEGQVRDMTMGLNITHKGLFRGLIEHAEELGSNVLTHIKELGITHLQLLPVYDFEGVDDIKKSKLYNWGYNPSQYFSIEGWFSIDPRDPYMRINEFRDVINYAHSINLGINMDVVFNHVYNNSTYPYDNIVPGYFYRHNSDNIRTNASYCGNDIETTKYMVKKLIIDTLIHFTEQYQIDGYRFDLMGLMDIDLMLEIETKLKAINPSIMLYGEGWNMQTAMPDGIAANMANNKKFPNIGHFNDSYRDILKGDLHGNNKGFIMGDNNNLTNVINVIEGSPHIFDNPNQSINFIECHDNLTLYDRMLLTKEPKDKIKIYQDFANHLVAISIGVPFFHAGQEFYRTKFGDHNSYNSSDKINMIHWQSSGTNIDNFKKILKIRKQYNNLYERTTYESFHITEVNSDTIIYILEDSKTKLVHILKNNFIKQKLNVKGELIFNSQSYTIEEDLITTNKPGVYIFKFNK